MVGASDGLEQTCANSERLRLELSSASVNGRVCNAAAAHYQLSRVAMNFCLCAVLLHWFLLLQNPHCDFKKATMSRRQCLKQPRVGSCSQHRPTD